MVTPRARFGWWLLAFGISVRLKTALASSFPDSLKRVAVAFHGQYMRKEELFHAHSEGCSVYFNDAQNISNALVGPLLGSGVDVLTFFHTMHHCPKTDQKLVDMLRPVSWSFSDCKLPRIIDSYLRVLDLVLAHDSRIDALVLSRFDVRYRESIGQIKIDWDKTNLAFPDGPAYWAKENKVSDLFHVLPAKHFKAFRAALDISTRKSRSAGHWIYRPLVKMVGKAEVRFIDPKGRRSNVDQFDPDPPFLFIDRSCKGYEIACVNRTAQARCAVSSRGRSRAPQ